MKHPIPYIYYVREVASKDIVSKPYQTKGAANATIARRRSYGWRTPLEVVAHAVLDIGEVVK